MREPRARDIIGEDGQVPGWAIMLRCSYNPEPKVG